MRFAVLDGARSLSTRDHAVGLLVGRKGGTFACKHSDVTLKCPLLCIYCPADDTGKCMPEITHAHQLSVNLQVKLVGMTQCVNGM